MIRSCAIRQERPGDQQPQANAVAAMYALIFIGAA